MPNKRAYASTFLGFFNFHAFKNDFKKAPKLLLKWLQRASKNRQKY